MSKITNMISFRAELESSNWLRVFNRGNISSTLHVLLRVARYCLDWNDFLKWKWMNVSELRKKKLVLIDKDARVCNTDNQE